MNLNEVLSGIRNHTIFNRGLFVVKNNGKYRWLDKEGLIYLCKICYNLGYEQRNLDLQQEKEPIC